MNTRRLCILTVLIIGVSFAANAQTVPSSVEAQIRADAEREWPDNYRMQIHTIETQAKAYLELQR